MPAAACKAAEAGYHAGLHLGRWYPRLANCITSP